FSLTPGPTGGELGSLPNSTVYNTIINSFLCPSDPNANSQRTNSYYASFGPTTYTDPIHTPGMFAVWTSYGIKDCTDGTSNTIAYVEALTGLDVPVDPSLEAPTSTPYRGNFLTGAQDPGFPTTQGPDDPIGYFNGGDQYFMASQNPAN